jgi:hypothetical protein
MSTVSNFIPQIWNAKVIRELENNLVGKQIANMNYDGEIKQKGDTVFFNSLGDVTVNSYSGTVSYEELSDEQVAMVIDQANYFAFNVQDIDAAQANVDLKNSQAQRAAYELANKCDQHILGLYAEAANTVTDATCDSSTIISDISEAGVYLDEQNVPQQGRYLIISPWVRAKLELAGVVFSINDGIKSGTGGLAWADYLGFKIYVSNNLTNASSRSSATECLALSGDAIAFAQQIMNTEDVRRESSFTTSVRGLHVFGAKVVQPKHMVRMSLTYAAETAV